MKPCAVERAVVFVPKVVLFRPGEMLDIVASEQDFIHLNSTFAFVGLEALTFTDMNATFDNDSSRRIVNQFPLKTFARVGQFASVVEVAATLRAHR